MECEARDVGIHDLVSRYCAAWNERDATRRHAALSDVWSPDAVYVDPSTLVVGIMPLVVHIGMVAARNPGSRIVMTSGVDAHHDEMRFGWARVGLDGSVIASGIDFAQRSESGLLMRVVGFLGDLPPLPT